MLYKVRSNDQRSMNEHHKSVKFAVNRCGAAFALSEIDKLLKLGYFERIFFQMGLTVCGSVVALILHNWINFDANSGLCSFVKSSKNNIMSFAQHGFSPNTPKYSINISMNSPKNFDASNWFLRITRCNSKRAKYGPRNFLLLVSIN